MVFPDLFQEEESCAFGVEGGMRWDEVRTLGETVNDTHNCVITSSSTMKSMLITSHGALGVSEGWSSPIGH
jgi:hypothetical protein